MKSRLTTAELKGVIILQYFLDALKKPKKKNAEFGIYVFRRYLETEKAGEKLRVDEYNSHQKAFEAAVELAREHKCDVVFWHRGLIQKDYAYFTGYAREKGDLPLVAYTK